MTLTVGMPNRFASAGVKNSPVWPVTSLAIEPSAYMVAFPGPDTFSVMAFPVLKFVNEIFKEPLSRTVKDPSADLSSLAYSLLTRKTTRTLKPQEDLSRVNGLACNNPHLGRAARAGDAVST